jgi:hypothetical protein
MPMILTPSWPSSMLTSSGAPSIEPGLEGAATIYRGHDGARKAWGEYRGEAWERLTSRPQEIEFIATIL